MALTGIMLSQFPSLTVCRADIYQDSHQVLFKMCPGLKDVPCTRPVHMGQSEEPRCPLHLSLPPPLYQPEPEPLVPEQLAPAPLDMYLSAAELQPTENLPLEFSDVGAAPPPVSCVTIASRSDLGLQKDHCSDNRLIV